MASMWPVFERMESPKSGRTGVRGEQRSDAEEFLNEPRFLGALSLERRRSERSSKPFLLMLVNCAAVGGNGTRSRKLAEMLESLRGIIRETDCAGWYENLAVAGLIFTELGDAGRAEIMASLETRMAAALRQSLPRADAEAVRLSFHFYPENIHKPMGPADTQLYPDFARARSGRRSARLVKRALDITATSLGLLALSPLLLVIAALVKLTSKGPVLFRQARIGEFGNPFTFLKFRSMYLNNDSAAHKEYVTQFIAGKAEKKAAGDTTVFKLTNDPRITRVGRFLRKTSLDELPQLFNVLSGKMSLIGPRPPLPYEFECYEPWHRRRVIEVKPGITGLWQVNGRSRTSFDEMVRLDLRYARKWSLWLDLKILMQTPGAVFSGDGAY